MLKWRSFFNIKTDSASFAEINERIESDATIMYCWLWS